MNFSLFALFTVVCGQGSDVGSQISPKETIPEYLGKYDIPVEEHWTTTEDGYILKLFRLPNPGAPVLLLQHGILCSSWHWVVNSPDIAPGIQLYKEGYDVWMTNSRGNTYSKNHTTLKPSFNKEFWDFSFADMGRFDVPANIFYILENTQKEDLTYVGWSQGTSQFFVAMTDEKTKAYIDKTVNLFAALAPVTWMKHQRSTLLSVVTDLHLDGVLDTISPWGFLNADSTPAFVHTLCELTGGLICDLTVNLIAGNSKLDTSAAITNLTAHFPAGISSKGLAHYAQLIRANHFRDFDYGKKGNLKRYNQEEPPAYDMTKIAVPTALFIGSLDDMGDVKDNENLVSHIGDNPALVYHNVFPDFSHMTWFTGTDGAFNTWYPDFQSLLHKYNPVSQQVV